MSWQDNHRTPAFRGVEFSTGSITVQGGRKLVTHTYPRGRHVEHEENGIDDEIITVNGFFVGKDYWNNWQDLRAAFNVGGSALMVHPYRGTLTVYLDSYRATEVSQKGQFINFSFTVHLDAPPEIEVYQNNERRITDAKAALVDASDAWLEDVYSLDRKPFNAIDEARSTLDSTYAGLDKARQSANTAAEYKRSIESARGDVISISLQAQAISNTYQRLIDFAIDSVDLSRTKKDQMRELRKAYDLTTQPIVNVSTDAYTVDYPARQIQTRMAYALVGAMGLLIPQIEYQSIQEAQEEATALFNTINDLSDDDIIVDGVYASMRDLKAAVFDYIESDAVNLPRLVDLVLPQQDNALALSYRYYGNITEVDTIVSVNGIMHPGFLPSGVTLQMRSSDE